MATAAVRRPSFETKRSTSSGNLAPNNEEETTTNAHGRPHKAKQFVVHRERHHTRVPSYGKNLSKLSKLTTTTAAADHITGHKHAHTSNSPKGKGTIVRKTSSEKSQSKVDEERRSNSSKRSKFKIGDSDCEDEQAHETEPKPLQRINGLVKSSSTRSLERQSREAKANREDTAQGPDKEKDSSGQKDHQSLEELEQQQQPNQSEGQMAAVRLSQAETLIDRGKFPPSRLFDQQSHSSAAAPKVNAECINGLHTPVSANPGSSSFPNNQALTSRFLDSPDRSGASISPSRHSADVAGKRPPSPPSSGPDKPSSHPPLSPPPTSLVTLSQTTAVPSRTQQKLWLQRASSQFDEEHQTTSKKTGAGGEWTGFSPKEFERITKEYYNVRRFRDPVGEALDRLRDNPKLQARIPRTGTNSAAQEAGMGLSQSLNSGFGRTARNQDKGLKGSRDDSGVKSTTILQRDQNVQALLVDLWNQTQPIPSNE